MKTIVKVFPSVVLGFFVGVFISLIIFYFYVIWSETSPLHKPIMPSAQNKIFVNSLDFARKLLKPATFVSSPLNGLRISQEKAKLPSIGVMVENLSPARPQSGLSDADIIYETLVEGGITRFLALFQSKEAAVVGPVRSARTYFAEIVSEYNAWYSHVGGSADSLLFIRKNKLNDLDQFFHYKPYWRDPQRMKRGLEHSMYVDTNALRKFVKGFLPDSLRPWKFKTEEKPPKPLEQKQIIEINFSKPSFKVRWIYDPATNSYLRYLGGIPHKDAQHDELLIAKNILIQYVKIAPASDPAQAAKGVLNIQLIGKGYGMLFRDGKNFPLAWRKTKSGERTLYFDENEEEITFNPGVIWVELVGNETMVKQES